LCNAVFTLGFSLRIEGGRRIPRRGPALIIANHQSFFDPLLIGVATTRELDFLARESLFDNPFFARLIRALNAVPIDQEGMSKEGIRSVLRRLEAGRAVVIFPEGTRTEDGKLQPLKPGIHLLLKRMQAPVIPIGIAGAFHALPYWRKVPSPSPLFLPVRKSALAVAVGKPLDSLRLAKLSRPELLAELSAALQRAITRAERIQRKV
jgi:1-acyl-sn-glycerol-3-phosphate acyltransferase